MSSVFRPIPLPCAGPDPAVAMQRDDLSRWSGNFDHLSFQRYTLCGWINCMNSFLVSIRSRKMPCIDDVTALLFCFSTPRIIMQR